jgi:hypothetical protein
MFSLLEASRKTLNCSTISFLNVVTRTLGEELCLLGYNAVQSVEIQPTFRMNMSPPSRESKIKKKQETRVNCYLPHAGFLLDFFFNLED